MNTYIKIHIPTAADSTRWPLDGQHLCFGHVIDREHGPKHMPVLLDVAYCIPWWRLHLHQTWNFNASQFILVGLNYYELAFK